MGCRQTRLVAPFKPPTPKDGMKAAVRHARYARENKRVAYNLRKQAHNEKNPVTGAGLLEAALAYEIASLTHAHQSREAGG